MSTRSPPPDSGAVARLRFAIIGPLLAAPPSPGELQSALQELADKSWKHPTTGLPVNFSFSTLERWFYAARKARDPVSVLRRRRRSDVGQVRQLSVQLMEALKKQYREHPGWTVQLHYDNLVVLVAEDEALGTLPSYATLRRYMKARGLHRTRPARRQRPGEERALRHREHCEVRSFEAEYTHGLWHLDFHHGSCKVLIRCGRWVKPLLLCIIDDHSRLVCHLQWYLGETAEVLVHGLSQAFQKRDLPRALMSDNGSAMQAGEFCDGLLTLSILHETTLPYSPYQNAKQEVFWAQIEGRLMAMLEGITDLTLERLNLITQAWVEQEYHRTEHDEIGTTPLRRYLDARSVGRECPDSEALRRAFRCTVTRRQRRSDGTFSLAGKRFEVPARYLHLEQLSVSYARWDLRGVELLDPHTGATLCPLYPLDKTANASGQRRRIDSDNELDTPPSPAPGNTLPPLLRKLLADYAATGQPPAYLPRPSDDKEPSS